MSDASPDVNPQRVKTLLDQSAQQLDEHSAAALRQARHAAVEKHRNGSPRLALAGAHGSLDWLHSNHAQWIGITILLFATLFSGVIYWQNSRSTSSNNLELAILTDDMPLEVFIDNF